MTNDVVIVGVGMTTAVGLSAPETAASVRARMMRFTETSLRDRHFDRFTIAEVTDEALESLAGPLDELAGLTAREARMLRLAAAPLRECLAPLAGRAVPIGLCLALPETETHCPLDRDAFVERLAHQANAGFDPRRSDGSHVGRAGGLVAVGQAVSTIQRGISEFMVAGGVDTFRDLYVLGTLDLEGRVKSRTNADGFVPGEGAAFVLLASERAAATFGLTPMARVSAAAVGFESGHLRSDQPYRGDGLATTIAQLVRLGAIEEPIGDVYSSMNGESHWAKEWGVSHLRNRSLFRPDHGMHHPADCFGDTGAACGPLMIGLASLGIRGSYRSAPALVYGSSDVGPRAALVVSAGRH